MHENWVSGVWLRTANYPIFIRLGRTRNQTKWGNGWSITKLRRKCSYLWLCWAPACWLVMVFSLLPFRVMIIYHYFLLNIEARYVTLKHTLFLNRYQCMIYLDLQSQIKRLVAVEKILTTLQLVSILGSLSLRSWEQLQCFKTIPSIIDFQIFLGHCCMLWTLHIKSICIINLHFLLVTGRETTL